MNITNTSGCGRWMLATVGGSYQHASIVDIQWMANVNQEADNKRANYTTTSSSSSSSRKY